MANQVVVTNSGNVQVSIEPQPNVQVQISRAAIGNIISNTANYANFANYAGNVTVANQPNITSVGNLATLTVTGNGTIGNLTVTGSLSVGNLVANNANYANFANVANTANSVAVSNVSGLGNIATTNYDGNASNVLYGNGGFYALPTISNVANANYANFAGNAFSVAGANVTGTVANANYAANAGNATVANTANSVSVGNVSGIGNIATVNLDGNSSNILYGNGSFAAPAVVNNVANANYANFAGTAFNVAGANVSGTVANANYASFSNIANLANSVAGANVTGTVANANYAAFANVANSANSVAVGNVVGIGNIATINLDGNSSNALLGNGSFGPVEVQSTSIANGTSNIDIPVANGNITVGINGNSNLIVLSDGASLINTYPLSTQTNTLRINSIGNPVADGGRVAFARYVGNVSNSTSVQPNDNIGSLLFFAHNGTGLNVTAPAIIRAKVDALYTANTANIPYGLQLIVGQTTQTGSSNINLVHNFYSNGLVNISGALSTAGLISATGNIQGANLITNGLITATGNITGGNLITAGSLSVTGNSNIGNIGTGGLITATGNITGGNLITGGTLSVTGNANTGNLGTTNIVATGNITGGNIIGTLANGTSNISIPAANGNINFSANGNANLVIIDTTGQMNSSPLSTATNGLRINTIGNPLSDAHRITWARSRGTVAIPTSVQNNDFVMSMVGLAHNGTAYNTTFPLLIRGIVDSTYTANTANVPMGLRFTVAQTTQSGSSNTSINHNFFSNGNVSFAQLVSSATLSVTGNANIGNIGTSGLITATGNVISANIQTGNASFGSGSSNLSVQVTGDKTPNSALSLTNAQFSVITDTPTSTGYTPFRFNYYDNNAAIAPNRNFRARGTFGTPTSVQVGDEVAVTRYVAYGDSGNTIVNLFDQSIVITQNNLAGNVLANLNFTPTNTASNIVLGTANTYATNMVLSGNLSATGRLSYLRTYGGFFNPNDIATTANTVANLELPNTYDANGISIVSNSQITIQRTGTYNIQFSLQVKNTDNAADHDIDVWFAKNGTDVANSASQWTVVKNDGKNICVVNFVDTVTTANDYYQIRYAVSSANVSLEAFANITTPYVRPAIPSAIVTVVPVGA